MADIPFTVSELANSRITKLLTEESQLGVLSVGLQLVCDCRLYVSDVVHKRCNTIKLRLVGGHSRLLEVLL